MNRIIKICSVVGCAVIVAFCIKTILDIDKYYSEDYVEKVYNDIVRRDPLAPHPQVKDCSAETVSEAPEGYELRGEADGSDGMKLVKVTWHFSNLIYDDLMEMEWNWIDYGCEGAERLDRLEKKDDPYGRRKVLPPGEEVTVYDYVLVPEQVHEMTASLGYSSIYEKAQEDPYQEVEIAF